MYIENGSDTLRRAWEVPRRMRSGDLRARSVGGWERGPPRGFERAW